jgi:hypothetical protein
MTKLITQVEIKEYLGMNKAVFSPDTIITPSARDWAIEHQIQILLDGESGELVLQKPEETPFVDSGDTLKQIVKTVILQLKNSGVSIDKDVVLKAVLTCLERLGCEVK